MVPRIIASVLLLALVGGCGKPPEPTGPAAEAMTDDIEITMEEPTVGDSAPAAEEATTR